MFKKSVFLLAALVATQFASAQEVTVDSVVTTEVKNADKYRVETNRFGSNWFIGFGVGGQMQFADHNKQMKVLDQITPNFEIHFGKWFTPGIGVRFGVNGYQLKGVSGWSLNNGFGPGKFPNNRVYQGFIKEPREAYSVNQPGVGYTLLKTEMEYLHAHADVMFNVSQMVCGFKPNRFYSFIPYAGLGFMTTLEPASTTGKHSNEVSASIGLLNRFRLSSALDLNLDVRGAYVHDRFDQQTGGRWGEGILSANIGLAYNFNKRDWDRSTITTIRINENALNNLRERVSQLQLMNDDLRRQLENALTREVTPENVCGMPLLVTFPIDRWVLSNKDRVNLGFLAEAIKKNPNMVYNITGFADKGTGSVKRNIFLARKRAEVIFDCLVNEFGVSESQLRKDSKGGVANMYYNDPRCSRAVLLQLAE